MAAFQFYNIIDWHRQRRKLSDHLNASFVSPEEQYRGYIVALYPYQTKLNGSLLAGNRMIRVRNNTAHGFLSKSHYTLMGVWSVPTPYIAQRLCRPLAFIGIDVLHAPVSYIEITKCFFSTGKSYFIEFFVALSFKGVNQHEVKPH